MFGFKKVVVEEPPPPASYSSAAIELLKELVAPARDYVPSFDGAKSLVADLTAPMNCLSDRAKSCAAIFAENKVYVVTTVFLLYVVVLLFSLWSPAKSELEEKEVAEEEIAEDEVAKEAIVTEEIPKEVGEEVEYVELVAASSTSSSGVGDDSSISDVQQDDDSVSDGEQGKKDDDEQEDDIEDDQSVEETYNDFLIKAAKSEDSAFAVFEEYVSGSKDAPQDGAVLKSPSVSFDKSLDVLPSPPKEAVPEAEAPPSPQQAKAEPSRETATEPSSPPQDVTIASPSQVDPVEKQAPSEDEMSALATLSEDAMETKSLPPPPSQKVKIEEDAATVAVTEAPSPAKPEPKRVTVANGSPKRPSNLQKGKSSRVKRSTSSNSLGNLKRNLSFNSLNKSMKKIFK
mmetsp:Transcript_42288/g.89935  ORF Transcript_42288/g.89935 Transcript_42288/m.89935 type:complete len:401 (+) Transcript_42288:85-1287(+)